MISPHPTTRPNHNHSYANQLFTALYSQIGKQDKIPLWTTHWMGLEPIHWHCIPVLEVLDFLDPSQDHPPILQQSPANHNPDRCQWVWLRYSLHPEWCPIMFSSKTLTDIKTHNANIEWECLSVCFGLQTFCTDIYSRHITVQNECKPLEMIQHMPIHTTHPHLQHMLHWLQKYDFTIHYTPGKEMIIANWLSRFPHP